MSNDELGKRDQPVAQFTACGCRGKLHRAGIGKPLAEVPRRCHEVFCESDFHVHGQRPVLEVLREDLGLTGTKCGCGEGRCGACTVLIGGKSAHSCITPEADRQTILTIEGLERCRPTSA